MQLITAPSPDKGVHPISIFLAGTVKDKDWREELTTKLLRFDVTVFNPRRKISCQNELETISQNIWEYKRIRQVKIIAFWFGPETFSPLSLYELGGSLTRRETQCLVVGIDKKHKLSQDIQSQCHLANQLYVNLFELFMKNVITLVDSFL